MEEEDPDDRDLKLDSDPEIVAEYLMKILGLPCFGNVKKSDLWMLLQRYSTLLMQDIMSKEQLKTVQKEHLPSQQVWDFLLYRSEKEKKDVPACKRTPVVCYRCKLTGHIARGCKFFRCFRCNEPGHTINGCRKRRPRCESPKGSRQSSGTSSPVPCRDLNQHHSERAQGLDDNMDVAAAEGISEHQEDEMAGDGYGMTEDHSGMLPDTRSECGSEGLHLVFDGGDDSLGSDLGQEDMCDDCDRELEEKDQCDSVFEDRGERVGEVTDEPVEHRTDCVNEDNFVLTRFSEEDEDRPCWTYLSDDCGVDCTDMALHDFVEYLESDANRLDDQSKLDILSAIKEDQAEMEMGIPNRYWFMYQ